MKFAYKINNLNRIKIVLGKPGMRQKASHAITFIELFKSRLSEMKANGEIFHFADAVRKTKEPATIR